MNLTQLSPFVSNDLARTAGAIVGWLALAAWSIASAGETLGNGIVLPDAWPPKRTLAELRSGEPMAVPYLKQPPAVIPIDVGRQLLVDDFLIEQTTLKRQFYKARLYEKNPVVRPDRRWENAYPEKTARAFSDGVWYDPQDKIFKMWYMGGMLSGTCYATSPDGITWTKPSLDVRPDSNVVLLSGQRDSVVVWLDQETTDPGQRFKLFQFNRDNFRPSLHVSADGIHWSEPTWCGHPSTFSKQGKEWGGKWLLAGDRTTMFYNPFRKVWVFAIRGTIYPPPWDYKSIPPKQIGRASLYWESKDFLTGATWKAYGFGVEATEGAPRYWYACDKLDSPGGAVKDELYALDAVAYENLMLGFFSVWHGGKAQAGRGKVNEVMLGFSRDGYHWDRPYREAVFPISESTQGSPWNLSNVQSVGGGCLIVGDRLFMYASGICPGPTGASTGLGFLRRDGFASMDAGDVEGTLTTRPVTFQGKHLFVNVAAPNGALHAEVLDREGKVIAPFSRENCVAIRADKTLQPVRWKGEADLSSVAGKVVRFRFYLSNGSLYSFWVSADKSGASRGYVAAGGPGFTGPTDTVGIKANQEAIRKPYGK